MGPHGRHRRRSFALLKAQISDAVHRALVEKFNVPADDRFQVISVHAPDELICPPAYLGIVHSKSIVIVQITCNAGRSLELKKALYARIAELIADSTEIGKNDVVVSLVEVAKEDWSFAQRLSRTASHSTREPGSSANASATSSHV